MAPQHRMELRIGMVHPRRREVDSGGDRETGEVWPGTQSQTLRPPSGVRAPVRPPRREGVSGASELGATELQPQISLRASTSALTQKIKY